MGKFFLYLFIAFAVLILLFFPIFLSADVYYQIRNKKVGFCISLYGKIKLVGGYISTYNGGFAIHLSEKKALLTGYREMEERRKNFPFQDFFTFQKISLNIRTGAEYFLPLYALNLINSIVLCIRPALQERIKSKLGIENGDELKVSARVVLKMTIFKQLKGFIKYAFRRVLSTWKMKRSTS